MAVVGGQWECDDNALCGRARATQLGRGWVVRELNDDDLGG